MMQFIIIPRTGIEGISFNTSREGVRGFLGSDFTSSRRTPGDRLYDFWEEHSVFAYYDDDDTLQALEFAKDAHLKLDGIELFSLNASTAAEFLRDRDPDLLMEEGGAGFTSNKFGIALWAPDAPEGGEELEAILLFRDGYYDE